MPPSETQQQLISVIVPCRNEAGYIQPFLEGVLAQERDGFDLEVLVCDGMSNDGTREILERFQTESGAGRVQVLNNAQGIVSTGLNAAIAAARGDIIVRMDVHTEYASNYLENCVATLQATGADNVGGPWIARGEGRWGRAIAAAFQVKFCNGGASGHDPNFEGPVDTVYLGCWRKDLFERVGLFDDRLVRNQDDELNLRIKLSGGVLWQSPRIRAYYRVRGSLRGLFRQYLQYGFWKVAVIRKHRRPAALRHLVPGFFVFVMTALLPVALLARIARLETASADLVAIWALILATYLIACLVCACSSIRRNHWQTVVRLPVVFATYHIAYGLGFLLGLFDLLLHPDWQARAQFTSLTR